MLNHSRTPALHLETSCIHALRMLVESDESKSLEIVLMSSWREDVNDFCALTHALLQHRILRNGFLSATPSFQGRGSRADEIVAWLLLHASTASVTQFVCLDDMDLEKTFSVCGSLLAGHCVKTSMDRGLTQLDSLSAAEILQSPFDFKKWQVQADSTLFTPYTCSDPCSVTRSSFALLLLNIVLYNAPSSTAIAQFACKQAHRRLVIAESCIAEFDEHAESVVQSDEDVDFDFQANRDFFEKRPV